MQKTLYELDRLEHILEKARGELSDVEKATYYAAANVLSQNLVARWNERKFSSIFYIETDMKDLMWHLNTLLGFVTPLIGLDEHYAKGVAKLASLRSRIETQKIVHFEYHHAHA